VVSKIFFVREFCIIIIIQQECIKLVKSESKDSYCYKRFPFQFRQEMFLEHKTSILERFLKDHVTEDWSNDAEITTPLFQIVITFHNITDFTVFLIK